MIISSICACHFACEMLLRLFKERRTSYLKNSRVNDFFWWHLNSHKIRKISRRSTKKVYEILKDNNINLNKEKCQFFVSKIKFLSQILKGGKLRVGIEAVDWKRVLTLPKTFRQLKMLIRYTNWYRSFVKNLSAILSDLNEKLKNKYFSWKPKNNKILENIKEALESAQELYLGF